MKLKLLRTEVTKFTCLPTNSYFEMHDTGPQIIKHKGVLKKATNREMLTGTT